MEKEWNIRNKNILITGATNGIGQATALELAKQGAKVNIVARNEHKCIITQKMIKEKTGRVINYYIADLSSQKEIRNFVQNFKNKELHVLINNAGLFLRKREESVDGIEMMFAINHLSYFLITNLLLDLIEKSEPSRIINVSSIAHRFANINFDDLQTKHKYTSMKAYSQSKLANILFSNYLAEKLKKRDVLVNSLHPGIVKSGFGLEENKKRSGISLFSIIGINSKKGAKTVIYLATSPNVSGITGKYWFRQRQVKTSKKALNIITQKRLWDISKELTGLK
jgi:NAD(P)-dependent dehydrogenase (short-subunit alcohol dehydrogenase family)